MEHTHFIDREPDKYEALTELQKQHIQSTKEEQVVDMIDRFESAWSLKTNDFRNARELGYRQYIHPENFDEDGNPNPTMIDILAIKGIRDKQRTYLINLKNHARDLKIHKNEPNDDGINVVRRINNVLKLSREIKVTNFTFISTDRAVRQKNTMGKTKKAGEIITTFYSKFNKKNLNYNSVRFGNVIGSSGSFIQILKKQLALPLY